MMNKNLYSREMLGNHHFHPLKNWLELEFQVDIVRFGRKQKVDSGIRGYGKVSQSWEFVYGAIPRCTNHNLNIISTVNAIYTYITSKMESYSHGWFFYIDMNAQESY